MYKQKQNKERVKTIEQQHTNVDRKKIEKIYTKKKKLRSELK